MNVVMALLVAGHSHRPAAVSWFLQSQSRGAVFLVPEEVVASFVRITSHPKFSPAVGGIGIIVRIASSLLDRESVRIVRPGEERLPTALRLITDMKLVRDDVPDAFLAALAMENDATLATFDRGFARFTGLGLELLERA